MQQPRSPANLLPFLLPCQKIHQTKKLGLVMIIILFSTYVVLSGFGKLHGH